MTIQKKGYNILSEQRLKIIFMAITNCKWSPLSSMVLDKEDVLRLNIITEKILETHINVPQLDSFY